MKESASTNWMLDEVIETHNKYKGNEDELVKTQAIQKVEYGRDCLSQFFFSLVGKSADEIKAYYEKLDSELRERIIEMGGEPKKHGGVIEFEN